MAVIEVCNNVSMGEETMNNEKLFLIVSKTNDYSRLEYVATRSGEDEESVLNTFATRDGRLTPIKLTEIGDHDIILVSENDQESIGKEKLFLAVAATNEHSRLEYVGMRSGEDEESVLNTFAGRDRITLIPLTKINKYNIVLIPKDKS